MQPQAAGKAKNRGLSSRPGLAEDGSRMGLEISRLNLLKLAMLVAMLAIVIYLRIYGVPAEQAGDVVVRTGYYFLVLNFILFVFFAGRLLLLGLSLRWLKVHLPGLSICLILTLITHLQEPHRFKVLNDEYALLNTSMALHHYQKAGLIPQAHLIEGELQHDTFTAGKRSLFFQTLLSVVHSVSGYRPANVFVLNFLITGCFFISLYFVLRSLVRQPLLVYCGLLAIASIPLLANISTSAGYDLLNATMILVFMLVGTTFLKSPDGKHQAAFVMTALLLGQVRYESILYLLALGFLVAVKWIREREVKLAWVSAFSPAFLFIPFMLNAHMFANEVLQDAGVRGSDKAFMGGEFLFGNLSAAARFFFLPGSSPMNAVPVSILGAAGLLFLVYLITKRGRQLLSGGSPALLCLVSVTVVAMACFLVMTMNFWGDLTDPQATRFAMPLYLVGAISGLALLDRMVRTPLQSWLAVLLAFASLGSGALTMGARKTALELQPIPRHHEWIIEYASTHPGTAFLYACDGTLGLVACRKAVVPIEVVSLLPREIAALIDSGMYDSIIVFELLVPDGESGELVVAPTTRGFKKSAYTYELVSEKTLSGSFISRAFRLTGWIDRNGNPHPFKPDVSGQEH